jgi:hypothetical protein
MVYYVTLHIISSLRHHRLPAAMPPRHFSQEGQPQQEGTRFSPSVKTYLLHSSTCCRCHHHLSPPSAGCRGSVQQAAMGPSAGHTAEGIAGQHTAGCGGGMQRQEGHKARRLNIIELIAATRSARYLLRHIPRPLSSSFSPPLSRH